MDIDDIVTDPALKLALETSKQTREQAIALLDLVSNHPPTSSPSHEFQLQISKQQKLLLTYLAQLRGLHRDAQVGARETKALTAEARQEVDRLHLQLQNLYYEQRHLQGEIAACESYDHKYQQLPLIPIEQFLAEHPEKADLDESDLTIARIEHEHKGRLALEEQRQRLLKKKEGLIQANKKRKDDLANLDKDLEKFIDAAKPIQKTFEGSSEPRSCLRSPHISFILMSRELGSSAPELSLALHTNSIAAGGLRKDAKDSFYAPSFEVSEENSPVTWSLAISRHYRLGYRGQLPS